MQASEAISLYRKPGRGYNLERLLNFVQNNAGNAIDAAVDILGPERFFKMIEDRRVTSSPKYEQLKRQYGRYVDSLETDYAAYWLDNLKPETEEEIENRHPFFKVFARREPVIWHGVKHLMCRRCNAIMPAKFFEDVTPGDNFALCYKCKAQENT